MNNNKGPCNDEFEKGYKFRWDPFSNTPYKFFLCKLKTEDGKFVKINIPENFNLIEFLNSFPSYNQNELINKDGLYTWILYTTDPDESIKFAAVEVKNAFEVGTLHKTLALKQGAFKIYGAGELQKNGNTITYSLQSGSFTKQILNSQERKDTKKRSRYFNNNNYNSFNNTPKKIECDSEKLERKIKSEFLKRFPGFNIKYIYNTMIDIIAPVKNEDIDFYIKSGISVDLYDTEEQCLAAQTGGKSRKLHRLRNKICIKTRKRKYHHKK